MASSQALLGTSSGDGVLAVRGGSCKVTTAEVARPVCQQEESLEFLSLDQVETVSLSLHPSDRSSKIWTPQFHRNGFVDTLHPSDSGSQTVTVISLFQGSWRQMKQTRSWLVQGSSLTNSAWTTIRSCACFITKSSLRRSTLTHSHRPNSPPTNKTTSVTTTSLRRAIKYATSSKTRLSTGKGTLRARSRGPSIRLVMVSFFPASLSSCLPKVT